MKLSQVLEVNSIPQVRLAELLGITEASISRKLANLQPWRISEAQEVLTYLQDVADEHLTLDDLFGVDA